MKTQPEWNDTVQSSLCSFRSVIFKSGYQTENQWSSRCPAGSTGPYQISRPNCNCAGPDGSSAAFTPLIKTQRCQPITLSLLVLLHVQAEPLSCPNISCLSSKTNYKLTVWSSVTTMTENILETWTKDIWGHWSCIVVPAGLVVDSWRCFGSHPIRTAEASRVESPQMWSDMLHLSKYP